LVRIEPREDNATASSNVKLKGKFMTIFLTGGAGYIGSHMAHALIDAGEQVVVVDDLSAGYRNLVPAQAPFYEGDVGDAALLARLLRKHDVEAVIHFAGSTSVPESVADPLSYYDNNTGRSRTLLAASVAEGVKHFIFSSTAVVYCPGEPMPLTEGGKINPISPYGASKAMTERMLADVGQAHRLTYCALRYFNVAGADPAGRTGQSSSTSRHLIKMASQVALGLHPQLTIFGADYPTHDGTCVRDYIHVTDLAVAHLSALRYLRGGGASQVMNVGYGRGYSVREVVETVKRVSGVDFPVKMEPRRPGDPAELISDPSRIRNILGWTPPLDDLTVIIEHASNWERSITGADRPGSAPTQRTATYSRSAAPIASPQDDGLRPRLPQHAAGMRDEAAPPAPHGISV
jgi:UDP-glucose 4-epimerase